MIVDTNVAGEVRVLFRMPPRLHAALTKLARRESRSLNGQMVYLLRQCMPDDLVQEFRLDEADDNDASDGKGSRP